MNFLTYLMHLAGSGAVAYYSAAQIRDIKTRPNILAGYQLAESGSVPFLTKLGERAAAEGDTWLAEKLAKHAADETRHGQVFAHALKQLDKQVIDFTNQPKSQPEETQTKKPQQRSPFFAAFFTGYTSEQLKPEVIDWNVFMGSTYILELDASKDFARMANVLPDDDAVSRNLKLGMLSIAQDEKGHASYLYDAIARRMPSSQVEQLIDVWRERKTKAMLAFARNLLQRKEETRSLVRDAVPAEKEPELVTV
ncbi:rubrerythrin family protein [Brunnivagina elsteri]|uniref:Rubrerythrin family protein n=1 Tax=Brunnivagina elsteri CCALA 953 TaxID=987040 RepID=A0A2A2TDW7_9CYAN|nr:rubrerythrin family protein [Calothrix elsteri]PAX51891.1 rubrerythrin family protein [Calothrix elsteri CCALA 953]